MAAVNNNSSVVVVGRTAPVPAGQQTSARSIPVVIASDQSPVPVEEQNKQQSEVALSLLGIPRSEVALGIFADVNTYDVNPSEWTAFPEQFSTLNDRKTDDTLLERYSGYLGDQDWGLTHIAEEAGALIEAPADEYAVLTSKRFFRYQPGRVSAATFGVRVNRAPYTYDPDEVGANANVSVRNPSIKKYGIFDKFDGYYFESRNDGYGDNFCCVRRTQSIVRDNPLPFSDTSQKEDYEWVGVPLVESNTPTYPNAYEVLKANRRYLQEVAVPVTGDPEKDTTEYDKCRRDSGLVIDGLLHDLKYGGNATTVYNTLRFFNKSDTSQLFVDTPQTEINRYTEIKSAIASIFSGNNPTRATIDVEGITGIDSVSAYPATTNNLPSVESGSIAAVDSLLDILITALGSAGYSSIPEPVGSSSGEMCVLRDGLILTHAAANDPSLLKEKVTYSVEGVVTDNDNVNWLQIKVPSGKELLRVGQSFYINKSSAFDTANDPEISNANGENIKDGSIWFVYDIRNVTATSDGIFQELIFSVNPANEESYTGVGGDVGTNPWGSGGLAYPTPGIFEISNTDSVAIKDAEFTLQTPTPFLLPNDSRRYRGENYTDGSLNSLPESNADGCFPYVYPIGAAVNAQDAVGYFDTTTTDTDLIKQQINYINKRLYKNWVWFNVDPVYYKVYEYRVPRTRFSGEKVNGIETGVVYSDNVIDKRAGQPVVEEATGEQIELTSVWDLDPTKVTMYKIEFSWYGAVGAIFLAYVPVDNGEARWVRLHHIRASNQLKVASLGNATLPITYLTYGGGSENRYGYRNSTRIPNNASGYGSYSEQLVKYGASYYIDGGDRGTVRLFSYASENLKDIGGSKYTFIGADNPDLFTNAGDKEPTTINVGADYVNAAAIKIDSVPVGAPAPSDYYINARVITDDSRDQDIRVVWVRGNFLYLSRALAATSGNVSLIVDRPQPLIGVKCRREINGVRNRVQIYPTRLSTGLTSNSESLVVELIKSPIFQTFVTPGVGASIAVDDKINIGKRGKKVILPVADITETGTYLNDGEKIYGYFRYTVEGDTSGQALTTLGLLQKEGDDYYFAANEVTLEEVNIRGTFLPAGKWSGPAGQDVSTITSPYQTSTLARLSGVLIDTEQRSPIPGTGTKITTLFTPNSGEQYELQAYFDYNKDYLSFPLTDLVDSLYICASSKSSNDGDAVKGSILASLTWEEQ